jgi:DNA-binding IscR family transcriptional regulator
MLDGTGILSDDLLAALSQAKLLTIKRGRDGGSYYPTK